jgi:hypothetical protein
MSGAPLRSSNTRQARHASIFSKCEKKPKPPMTLRGALSRKKNGAAP